jgi:glutamate--cysteine ligase
LDAAWDLAKNWTAEFRETLRINSARSGLAAQVDGVKLIDLAKELVDISRKGLIARGRANVETGAVDESRFLDPLFENLATQKSPADRLLGLYSKEWNTDLQPIYRAARIG